MILDLDNGLPTIHMKFGTLDLNGETFFTYVDSCAGMNVVNIQLHQCIITNNPDILESYIQFNNKNSFVPIHFISPLMDKIMI